VRGLGSPIACGPVTDFRGERTPKKDFVRSSFKVGRRVSIWAWSRGCGGSSKELEMAKFNPFKFMQEVRQETNKVTWPSRKETGITTAMVFVFAAAAAVFFLLADQVIRMVVTLVLGIGT
jgi:preprotein translocase subunit SecE